MNRSLRKIKVPLKDQDDEKDVQKKFQSENPWNINSIYKFQYFNCPTCEFKNNSKQVFIDHAFNVHKEAIEYLKNINDGSINDITFPLIEDNPDETCKDVYEEYEPLGSKFGLF